MHFGFSATVKASFQLEVGADTPPWIAPPGALATRLNAPPQARLFAGPHRLAASAVTPVWAGRLADTDPSARPVLTGLFIPTLTATGDAAKITRPPATWRGRRRQGLALPPDRADLALHDGVDAGRRGALFGARKGAAAGSALAGPVRQPHARPGAGRADRSRLLQPGARHGRLHRPADRAGRLAVNHPHLGDATPGVVTLGLAFNLARYQAGPTPPAPPPPLLDAAPAAARDALHQTLLEQVSHAFAEDVVVQFPVAVQAAVDEPAPPNAQPVAPRLFGGVGFANGDPSAALDANLRSIEPNASDDEVDQAALALGSFVALAEYVADGLANEFGLPPIKSMALGSDDGYAFELFEGGDPSADVYVLVIDQPPLSGVDAPRVELPGFKTLVCTGKGALDAGRLPGRHHGRSAYGFRLRLRLRLHSFRRGRPRFYWPVTRAGRCVAVPSSSAISTCWRDRRP